MISSSTGATVCTYPENSAHVCLSYNPCSFSCTNGFESSGTGDCICPDDKNLCDGVCQLQACPTAAVSEVLLERRTAPGSALRRRAVCRRGLTACGIFERRGTTNTPWECIDTARDLESCKYCYFASTREVMVTDGIAGRRRVHCASGLDLPSRDGLHSYPRCRERQVPGWRVRCQPLCSGLRGLFRCHYLRFAYGRSKPTFPYRKEARNCITGCFK